MHTKLKHTAIAAIIIAFTNVLYAADIEVSVTPNPLFVGETGQFQIVSKIGKPTVAAFPNVNGIKWVKSAPYTSVQIVNFDRTDILTYRFTVVKPGTYLIPSTEIQVANRMVKANPVKIVAQKRQFGDKNQSLTLDDLIFLKLDYDGSVDPPKKIYLGQEIMITIKLYVDFRLEIYADKFNQSESFTSPHNYFPAINLDNVVYRDYSAKNQHNSKFLYKDSQSEIVDDRRFQVFTYQTSISGVEVGEVKGTVEHTVPLIDPNRQPRRSRSRPADDFFGFDDFLGFSGLSQRKRILTHRTQASVPPISVTSVPPSPDSEGYYLGLIGSWDVQLKVDRSTVSVGEDVTVTLNVQGQGNIDPLSAPEVEYPGFRVYPPEVNREVSGQSNESKGTINWVIIPLNISSQLPRMSFKTFNSELGEFEVHDFQPTIKIKESTSPKESGPIINDYAKKSSKKPSGSREVIEATDILYIKKELGVNAALPLWKNVSPWVGGLGVFGPVCYLSFLFLTLRKEKLQGSQSYKRRRIALKNRRRIFREIKQSSASTLPHIVREELIPFLKAILDLPPGATNTELLEKINDKELIEILNQAEVDGFMPGKSTQIDSNVIIKKVKNLLLIVCCFLTSSIGICEDSFETAVQFYDQGRIQEAKEIYQNLLKNHSGNAALLFNLGNCAYRESDYGSAIAYYERGRRLRPRDSDIIENLNFVRSQLNQPPVQTKETPLALVTTLRDQLRPDEWLVFAGISWCMVWIVLSINRVKRYTLIIVPIVLSLVLVIAISAFWAQNHSTYLKNQAIVIAQDTPIFRVPGQSSDKKAKFVLNTGDYLTIVEKRSKWSRVRIDQAEGWIKNGAIKHIW